MNENLSKAIDFIQGEQMPSLEIIIEKFELKMTPSKFREACLDNDIQECPSCGTWVEVCEIIMDPDDEEEIIGCEACSDRE